MTINTPATPIYREQTNQNLVEIYDRGDTRSLYFGGKYLQSRMSLSTPQHLLLPYTRYMMFVLLLVSRLEHILLVGLGAGSLVRFIHHHFPECTIDAVDCSEQVIKLARGYFKLPQDGHIHIHCQDGYQFLDQVAEQHTYDLVMVDAFNDEGMSEQIYSDTFFQLCAQVLKNDGFLCTNLWSGKAGEMERITQLLSDYFDNRLLLPVPERGNHINIATAAPLQWHKICRGRKELKLLGAQFHLNFQEMVRVALQHNMSFGRRLRYFFSA